MAHARHLYRGRRGILARQLGHAQITTTERLEEFLRYWRPGEHALAVERHWPAPRGARAAACTEEAVEELLATLVRLVPLYRYGAWSQASDFLFR